MVSYKSLDKMPARAAGNQRVCLTTTGIYIESFLGFDQRSKKKDDDDDDGVWNHGFKINTHSLAVSERKHICIAQEDKYALVPWRTLCCVCERNPSLEDILIFNPVGRSTSTRHHVFKPTPLLQVYMYIYITCVWHRYWVRARNKKT